MSQALYAQWPSQSRRTYGWAALLIALGGYFVSAVPLAIGLEIWLSVNLPGEADPLMRETRMQAATLPVLMPLLLAQFIVWSALTLAWAIGFERRSLSSLGLALSAGTLWRYLTGLGLGVALLGVIAVTVIILDGGASAAGTPLPAEGAGLDSASLGEILSRPGIGLVFVGVTLIFLIQGGSEELVFRGWLMSTLTARWGLKAAVIVSGLIFALVHLHVFVSGLIYGIAVLTGIGLIGLVFALLSVLTRSVWEAAAAHGAFNAAAVILPTLALLVADPQLDIGAAFAQVFTSATGQAGPDAVTVGVQTWAQAISGGVLAALLLVAIARLRPPGPPWRAPE